MDKHAQTINLVKKKNSFVTFLSSLNLTIWLLLILALTSILGSIIPQQGTTSTIHTHLSPVVLKLFMALRLFDVYHSYWFLSLTGLLCLNLVLCTTTRLPSVVSSVKKTSSYRIPKRANTVRTSIDREQADAILKRLEKTLRLRYGKVSRQESATATTLFAHRGRYRRISLLIAHLSILVIILGMTVGRYTGIEGYIELSQGETAKSVHVNNAEGILDLGFTLRCDQFTIDFYENGMPKDFLSKLSFIEDGHTLSQESLRVNYPVTYKGFRFYQANYGMDFSALIHIIHDRGNQSIHATKGRTYSLDDGQTVVRILRIEDNFMRMGPAVQLEVSGLTRKEVIWLFKNINGMTQAFPDLFTRAPRFNPALYKPYLFSLEELKPSFSTGLMITRDPGAAIVASGGLLFFLGIFISLISPRKRIWARLQDDHLTLAVQASGTKPSSDRELRQILQKAQRAVK